MDIIKHIVDGYWQGELENQRRPKQSFWASETEALNFDLYHKWIGTPPTNPIEPEKMLMFQSGLMIEQAIVNQLDGMGLVSDRQKRIEMTRCDVPITGYIDAVVYSDEVNEIVREELKQRPELRRLVEQIAKITPVPLEVKTFYGDWAERELQQGTVKLNHAKQLAIYLDALQLPFGVLLYMNRGTGALYQFLLQSLGNFTYQIISANPAVQKFNLLETYERWKELYVNHIIPKVEPKCEERYKIPITEIDWTKVSKTDISKARNNQKVIGDGWRVAYSPYKNLILKQQNTALGYTEDELIAIREATKGYSSAKNAKMVSSPTNEAKAPVNAS